MILSCKEVKYATRDPCDSSVSRQRCEKNNKLESIKNQIHVWRGAWTGMILCQIKRFNRWPKLSIPALTKIVISILFFLKKKLWGVDFWKTGQHQVPNRNCLCMEGSKCISSTRINTNYIVHLKGQLIKFRLWFYFQQALVHQFQRKTLKKKKVNHVPIVFSTVTEPVIEAFKFNQPIGF